MRSLLLCSALLVSWVGTALATDFTGKVIGVLDGDTIEVLHNQHPKRIRLSAIDCPEKGTDTLRADCSRPEIEPGCISVRHPFMGLRESTARDSAR